MRERETDCSPPGGSDDAGMAAPTREPSTRSSLRGLAASGLLVLGGVLSIATIAGVWTRALLLDTDRYVETVSPLASDIAVRETATRRVVDALMSSVDVEALAADALPTSAASFAPALAAGIRSVVDDSTRGFFASAAFRDLWDDANRAAHRQVVRLLTGEGDVVTVDDGMVVIDLVAIAEQVRVSLVEAGVTFLDGVPIAQTRARLEVMEADELTAVQDGVDLIQALAWWLPLGVVGSFGAAVLMSRDRRVGVRNVGITLASSMVLLGVAFGIGRRLSLDAMSGLLDPAAAEATFDILTRHLRRGVRIGIAVGLLLVMGAWLRGPSGSAERVRDAARRAADRRADGATEAAAPSAARTAPDDDDPQPISNRAAPGSQRLRLDVQGYRALVDKHQFLSDTWLDAVRSLKERYRDDAFDQQGFRVNAVVTGVPFAGGVLELHSDHGPMIGWVAGLDPSAAVTITVDYDIARSLVLDRSPNALEIALGAGDFEIDGEFDQFRDWWHSRVGNDDVDQLEREIRSITL